MFCKESALISTSVCLVVLTAFFFEMTKNKIAITPTTQAATAYLLMIILRTVEGLAFSIADCISDHAPGKPGVAGMGLPQDRFQSFNICCHSTLFAGSFIHSSTRSASSGVASPAKYLTTSSAVGL